MRLPDLRTDEKEIRDREALIAALSRALEPVTEEIENTVKELRSISPLGESEFNSHAVTFTLERLSEAVEEMVEKAGPGERSAEWVAAAARGFSDKSLDEQNEILSEMLKNTKFQTKLTSEFLRIVGDDLYKNLDKLVEIGELSRTDAVRDAEEMARIERERDRRDSRGRAESRVRRTRPEEKQQDGILAKLLEALNGRGGLFSNLMDKITFGIGGIGLASMLPKEVREFIGDFTSAFTTIKTLLQSSWLAPMFKILESIPIVGAILKKVPLLAAILAGFEIIPKVWERFQSEGGWAALEEGLQGVYRFFVGDLVELVGGWMDKIKVGLLGATVADKVDFSAMTRVTNDVIGNIITDVVSVVREIGKILVTGVDDGTLDKVATDLFWDLVDGWVAIVRSFLKYDPESEFSVRQIVEEFWSETAAKIERFFDNVKRWWSEGFTDEEKEIITRAFTAVVYDAPLEVLKSVGSWMRGVAADLGEKLYAAMTSALASVEDIRVDLRDSLVSMATGAWESVKRAVMDAVETAIEAGLNLGEDIKTWFRDMWSVIKNAIWDSVASVMPGMSPSVAEPDGSLSGVNRLEKVTGNIVGLTTPQHRGAPVAPVTATSIVNQNKAATIQNYGVIGPRRAGTLNPNSSSTGGGSGWR